MCRGGGNVTRTEPWEGQKPYLEEGFTEAKSLFDSGMPSFYSGDMVEGFSPAGKAAQTGMEDYVTGGRAESQQVAAEDSLKRMLSGNVDDSKFNPVMDAMTRSVMGKLTSDILPQVQENITQYIPGGGSRGDIVTANVTTSAVQKLADEVSKNRYGAYQDAQQLQAQGGNMYPSMMGAPISAYAGLNEMGEQQRMLGQAGLDAEMGKYEYESLKDRTNLQDYMANISGEYGGTTKAPSLIQSLLGGLV
jgi:hypothetical protein